MGGMHRHVVMDRARRPAATEHVDVAPSALSRTPAPAGRS